MAGAGESGLPKWAEAYLPDFRRILHAVEMSDGFVLFPIEVPSFDVAAVLAKWLDRNGHPCLFISDERVDWAQALLSEKPAGGGVALMFGGEGDPQLEKSLHLLNQRRDTLAKNLSAPLLWCGSRKFLDSTWRLAPDLWSVADVPRRIVRAATREERGRIIGRFGVEYDTSPAEQHYAQALAQHDDERARVLGLYRVEKRLERCDLEGAHALLFEMRALRARNDPGWEARISLLAGKLAMMKGQLDRAESELSRARDVARDVGSPWLLAEALGSLGAVHLAMGRLPDANHELGAAFEFFGSAIGFGMEHGDTLVALGDYEAKVNHVAEAEAHYSAALAVYDSMVLHSSREIGRANALLAQGALFARTDRFREAERNYAQALAIYETHDVPFGKANVHLAFGRLYTTLERFDEARASYEAALQILLNFGLFHWVDIATRELEALPPR